ncbi:DUF3943 domain-containing protein [Bacteroidota bacterium]
MNNKSISSILIKPEAWQKGPVSFKLQPPELINNDETMNFGKRFLYSQKILWPTSVLGHIGLYVSSTNGVNWNDFRFETIKESFTKPPIVESDPWVYNYMVHPVMGSFSYLSYRNRGAGWWESCLGTGINSAIYEYVIASSTQRPSIVDLSATTIGGAILGESIFQLKKQFYKDNYLSLLEKILITILDPFEVLHVKFRYSRLI